MFNPYITQICEQTGMTEREARRHARHANLTIEQANAYGFETVEEYEQAILDYVYNWVTKSRLTAAFFFYVIFNSIYV